jgi:hypothetical protein
VNAKLTVSPGVLRLIQLAPDLQNTSQIYINIYIHTHTDRIATYLSTCTALHTYKESEREKRKVRKENKTGKKSLPP